jgi:UDP-N-acetylmuramoyl-L-alanyl-D-glutamate--2,6-diaminopimelate ligase
MILLNRCLELVESSNYEIEKDRTKAIHKALNQALKDDIVFIVGKGSDNYMIINNNNIPYNDYDVVLNFYKEKKLSQER